MTYTTPELLAIGTAQSLVLSAITSKEPGRACKEFESTPPRSDYVSEW